MERVMVVITSVALLIAALAGAAQCMNCYPPPSSCAPPCSFVTRMVPCVQTQMVAEVVPCSQTVPVTKVGYRIQKFLLKGTPVGQPCGINPCIKCCPQPFCQVVEQKVPYYYCDKTTVTSYNLVYKPVCRPVMLPQTYMVQSYPMCP